MFSGLSYVPSGTKKNKEMSQGNSLTPSPQTFHNKSAVCNQPVFPHPRMSRGECGAGGLHIYRAESFP